MKDYLAAFDAKAKELSAASDDIELIVSEIREALPERPEGEFLIGSNIQVKYLKK